MRTYVLLTTLFALFSIVLATPIVNPNGGLRDRNSTSGNNTNGTFPAGGPNANGAFPTGDPNANGTFPTGGPNANGTFLADGTNANGTFTNCGSGN